MSPRRPLVPLLGLVLLGGGAALAQDELKDPVPPAKVKAIVDAQAAEENAEERKGNPQDSDEGESSYNVSDCGSGWKGEGGDSDDSSGSDPDATEECEDMDK